MCGKGGKIRFCEGSCAAEPGYIKKYLESYGDKTREIVQRAAKGFNIRMI